MFHHYCWPLRLKIFFQVLFLSLHWSYEPHSFRVVLWGPRVLQEGNERHFRGLWKDVSPTPPFWGLRTKASFYGPLRMSHNRANASLAPQDPSGKTLSFWGRIFVAKIAKKCVVFFYPRSRLWTFCWFQCCFLKFFLLFCDGVKNVQCIFSEMFWPQMR